MVRRVRDITLDESKCISLWLSPGNTWEMAKDELGELARVQKGLPNCHSTGFGHHPVYQGFSDFTVGKSHDGFSRNIESLFPDSDSLSPLIH